MKTLKQPIPELVKSQLKEKGFKLNVKKLDGSVKHCVMVWSRSVACTPELIQALNELGYTSSWGEALTKYNNNGQEVSLYISSIE